MSAEFPSRDNPFERTPLIIGHRGAAGLVPENTLPSFVKAAALGVDVVELDIHRLGDELLVIHDDTLERTTNGSGPLDEMTVAEVRTLDAGNGASIPVLDEVFEILPSNVGINIELKGPDTAALAAETLSRHPEHEILVSSFDHDELRRFTEHSDHIVAPLFHRWRDNPLQVAADFGGGYLNLSRKLITPSRMTAILGAGLRVLVYTVNDINEARRLFQAGVWGVFTDYPDRISRATL